MNVRPLHDRIIVRRLEEGEQHIGGIIIPDTAKEKPQRGTVIAAGNGKAKDDGTRVPLDVRGRHRPNQGGAVGAAERGVDCVAPAHDRGARVGDCREEEAGGDRRRDGGDVLSDRPPLSSPRANGSEADKGTA